MLLLSPDLLELLKRIINLAYFFRSIPFKWSETPNEAQVVFPKTASWNLYRWEVMAFVHLTNQIFIYVRLLQLIHEAGLLSESQDVPKFNHTVITLATLYMLGYSVISAVQIVFIHYKYAYFQVINLCLTFITEFQENYSRKGAEIPRWQNHVQVIIKILIFISIANTILAFIFFYRYPSVHVSITSLAVPEYLISNPPWWVRVAGAFIICWCMLAGWSCIITVSITALIFIFSIIFVLQECRCGRKSKYTSDELQSPHNFLQVYKSLQLLSYAFNCIVGPYILMAVNNICLVLSVGGQIILIQLHGRVDAATIACTAVLAIAGTAFLIISYFKLGEVNESSKKCIASWKRNAGIFLTKSDKELVKRYVRSLGVVKIELGGLGCYKKANSLRIIGKIIYYTTKGLMLMQKILRV